LATRLPLKDNELVFVPEKGGAKKLTAQALSQAFNKLVLKLKLSEPQGKKPKDLRLYCLRKAFRKFMASAVDSAYVEFWMGHTEIPSEDIAKLKLENIELRIQIEKLGKRLETLERLLSRPSLQIDKEALSSAEKLARKLPKKYQAEA